MYIPVLLVKEMIKENLLNLAGSEGGDHRVKSGRAELSRRVRDFLRRMKDRCAVSAHKEKIEKLGM